MKKYKQVFTNSFVEKLLALLVEGNFLEEIKEEEKTDWLPPVPKITARCSHYVEVGKTCLECLDHWEKSKNYQAQQRSTSSPPVLAAPYGRELKNPFLGNGMPLESNMESIARTNLGVCEDRKDFSKALKAAVGEYSHDEVLNAFYDWAQAQAGSFMGRKPVSMFLKNIGQHILISKPTVTNPNLEKTLQAIALCSDNKVFFTGEYRVRLALLLKEHGVQLVNQAFAEFWSGMDDRAVPWAPRDFLQQADIRINTLKQKELQALAQAQNVAAAYELAKVDKIEEPEEESDEL